MDEASAPTWKCLGASVQGTSHAKVGMPCQDAHSWKLLDDGTLIVAVADGAGSAPHSEIGARAAVSAAVAYFQTYVDDAYTANSASNHLTYALDAAREAVIAEADRLGCEVRELASTLILVLATPTEVWAQQTGDGAVVVRCLDGSLIALTSPRNGEYPNETTFLTSEDARDEAQNVMIPYSSDCLAIFTDGLQPIALNLANGEPHAPFFEPLLQFASQVTDPSSGVEQLEKFLSSPRVAQRTDDDLTLVLAVLQK